MNQQRRPTETQVASHSVPLAYELKPYLCIVIGGVLLNPSLAATPVGKASAATLIISGIIILVMRYRNRGII